MKLSDFARRTIKGADLNGYAHDRFLAADPLIKPFADFDELVASIKPLKESTMALCWIDSKCKVVPINEAEFARVQKEIAAIQAKIDNNAAVLDELEAKVAELGILLEDRNGHEVFSLNMMEGARKKLLGEIGQIKSDEADSLNQKWRAVIEVGGDQNMFLALPEVQEIKRKTTEKIAPIEDEIRALDGKVKALQQILWEIKR